MPGLRQTVCAEAGAPARQRSLLNQYGRGRSAPRRVEFQVLKGNDPSRPSRLNLRPHARLVASQLHADVFLRPLIAHARGNVTKRQIFAIDLKNPFCSRHRREQRSGQAMESRLYNIVTGGGVIFRDAQGTGRRLRPAMGFRICRSASGATTGLPMTASPVFGEAARRFAPAGRGPGTRGRRDRH